MYGKDDNYTVYVGGAEVNDFYLTKSDAERLASLYMYDGYDDVIVVQVN